MVRLLQISDLHFGTEVGEVVEALHDAYARLAPSVVVCTGDVTQRAREDQFRRAQAFFARFDGTPLVVVPGNHDVPLWNLWARFARPYAKYQATIGELERTYSTDGLLLVALNTTRHYRHKDGSISREQVHRVRQLCEPGNKRRLSVVVAHHPLFVRNESDRHNQVHGGAVAGRIWSEAGVDLVLGGHIHLPYVEQFPLPSDRQRLWVVQAGTTISARVRDSRPNSFNVIDWDGARCTVARWDYSPQSGFEPADPAVLFER